MDCVTHSTRRIADMADTKNTMEPILAVRGLKVSFTTPDGDVNAVKGIDLDVRPGETLAVVGESGSGKSQTMMGIMGLLASNGRVTGSAKYRGREMVGLPPKGLNEIRGAKITMIFQEPMTSLDPLYPVGKQVAEVIAQHRGGSRRAARPRVLELLKLVGIPDPERRIDSYPHELSGGQRQRVMIAMALANEPDILIADEPTTALDVTIQAQILKLLRDLQTRFDMAIVLITHDLGIVRHFAERVAVMRRGEIVEQGATADIFENPQADYTRMLIEAEPHGRKLPPADNAPIILEGRNVVVDYKIDGGLLRKRASTFRAVDNVSISLHEGQTIGVVGESGSGKSTLGRALLRLISSKGAYRFGRTDISGLDRNGMRPLRRSMQVVFQDPLRIALTAPDGGRDHHRGALCARAAAFARGPRQAGDRGLEGGRARSGSAQPLSARVLRRPAPAHRDCTRHDPETAGRHPR
jgi:oligopeptide transport system ATP-binding protein